MARTKNFNEQDVLEKILDLFRRKGFFQSSLDDILCVAGISKQSIYDTYGDKRTLFIKALRLFRETSIQNIGDYVQGEIDIGKSSLEILRVMLHPKESADGEIKCCLITNSMMEFRGKDTEICSEIDIWLSFLRIQMEKVITVGQYCGEITTSLSASQIADILLNVRNGVQVGQDFRISAKSLADTADWTIDLVRAR